MRQSMHQLRQRLVATLLLGAVFPAQACTACFGQSDSEMAQGMNWGIYTLLAFVGLVLGCVTAFFVALGRRSAQAQSSARTDSEL